MLAQSTRPILLAGRIARDMYSWNRRIELAERLGAVVLTDLKQAAAFPTDHALHTPFSVGNKGHQLLCQADLVVSLDWLDPAGTLKLVQERGGPVGARFVQCSPEPYSHNGWSMDHQALPRADIQLLCEPEALVDALLTLDEAEGVFQGRAPWSGRDATPPLETSITIRDDDALDLNTLARVLRRATSAIPVTLIRTPLGWSNTVWHYRHPLDFLGKDGGAGIGSGPGMAIGAALALKGSGRLPLAVLGDGDFMFSANAWWTAVQARIPLLAVIANNQSYFNDEIHQERVAIKRGRPIENKGVAQTLADPDPDLAAIARAQGALAYGPLATAGQFAAALEQAISATLAGNLCVIDARILPGYQT